MLVPLAATRILVRQSNKTSPPGSGLPRRRRSGRWHIELRRQRRVLLGILRYDRNECLPSVLQLRRGQPESQRQPCVRFSVALPPGIGRGRSDTRLRATATRTTEGCITSVTTGTAGRRRFPRVAAIATIWTSVIAGSSRITSTTVRTAFSCVASRNRESGRWALQPTLVSTPTTAC